MNIKLAGCVIEDNNKKILLMHRNTPKRVQWELPGGKIEEQENPRDTAIREVREELGIDVEIVKKLGGRIFTEDGLDMEYVWFLAKIIKGEPTIQEEKFDELRYFSWEELRERNDLSGNLKNLVGSYFKGDILTS